MAETVTLSGRGQITIPADMRRRLGVEPGGTMTIEETAEGLLLRPSIQISVELELYSDEDIARWDEEDRFAEGERERLLERLGGRAGNPVQ
jgi:antitoxin PrlF